LIHQLAQVFILRAPFGGQGEKGFEGFSLFFININQKLKTIFSENMVDVTFFLMLKKRKMRGC